MGSLQVSQVSVIQEDEGSFKWQIRVMGEKTET